MKTALTIGNFDGVHRGHRKLLETILNWKRENSGSRSIVLTFEPHPAEVLSQKTMCRLSSSQEKIQLIQQMGVDDIQVISFNKDFAQTSPRDFFEEFIVKKYSPGFICVGHNFFFGKDRKGSPGNIIDWSQELSIQARVIEPIESDGEMVSSSRIRTLIAEGKMSAASRLLGRDYSLTNEVVHGDKRGRTLGFPTANIFPPMVGTNFKCLPAKGVYFTSAHFDGRSYPSVTNVGTKPTVSQNQQIVIETHLLDFDGDLYGKYLSVEFRDRIRDEKRFSSLEELRQQIQIDTALARSKLSS